MLFNSYVFIFVFLPVVLAATFGIRAALGHQAAMVWLTFASLFFYTWWNPAYLALLLPSLVANYGLGVAIRRTEAPGRRWWIMAGGVAANLAVLSYFKYADFFLQNVGALTGGSYALLAIALPLGISFITFQKVAYLVDCHAGKVDGHGFWDFALFVTFFPQLIAGPIVLHHQLMPQFQDPERFRPRWDQLAVGATIFVAGLFKKVILADGIAPYANKAFDAAAAGTTLTALQAWTATFAYTMQLYFDFSAYSEMALGAALMLGVQLPLNFFSPYKARNIADFWRRWHMTLGAWLGAYLYTPLALTWRALGIKGAALAAIVTFFVSGLWHGAAWTFVAWGALHGVAMAYEVLTRKRRKALAKRVDPRAWGLMAWASTFGFVMVGYVLFRSADLVTAGAIYASMVGWYATPPAPYTLLPVEGAWLVSLGFLALFAPNLHEVLGPLAPSRELQPAGVAGPSWLRWSPDWRWALVTGGAAACAVLYLARVSEFLYFQF